MAKHLVLLFTVPVILGTSAFAQDINDFMKMFGDVMQQAMRQAAQTEWAKVPETERLCIDQSFRTQGMTLQGAIQQGIGPSDVRLSEIRQQCATANTLPQARPPQSSLPEPPQGRLPSYSKSVYSVDGLALGERVYDKVPYRDYKCEASEQFPTLTTCRNVRDGETNGQRIKSFSRILHSAEGEAVYINREVEPAFFRPNDLNAEIARLSARFGSQPSIIKMQPRPGYSDGIIASWGEVALEPLDPASIAELAAGRNVRRGYMVDFIADFGRSAQLGLPVYRLGGRAGFVYAASYDERGRGRLRFLAVDGSAFSPQTSPLPPATSGPAELKETAKVRESREFLEVVRRCLSEQERPIPSMPDIAREAAQLQLSIDSANERAAIQKMHELKNSVNAIPEFKVCQLTASINQADKNIFFIDRYAKQNLGDKTVEPLLSIRENLWQAIATSAVDNINEVNIALQNYVISYGLRGKYDDIVSAFPTPAKPKTTTTE